VLGGPSDDIHGSNGTTDLGSGFAPATSDLESSEPTAGDEDTVHTRPPSTSIVDQRPALADLLDLEAFREICASFVDLYKIGIKIFDADGTKLVDIRVGNGDWCGYIFSNRTGRAKCTSLVTRIKQFKYPELEKGMVVEQTCFSGLKYVVMPVSYAGDVLGRVVYGPFLPANLQRPGDEVYEFGDGFDPNRLWQYGDKIRRAPDETIIKILNNFRGVVDTVTFIAMKAMMTRQLHVESITESYKELSESNRQLRESLERLQELDRMKSTFLATVSHELKTPLTSVIGYSEMLIDGMAGELNPEQKKYLATIKERGEGLLDLIGSLLDLSRIEAGRMDLRTRPVRIEPVVEDALSSVVPQAQKRGVELRRQLERPLPEVVADPDKLRQVLVNLLGNAVKFTRPPGKIEIRVGRWRGARAAADPDERFGPPEEDFLRMEVADEGIGIPTDKLDRIFESFYQVDGSITREHGGSGLGLAISKKLVEAHDGEIHVASRPGEGTRFTVLLPLQA
jgi:signal transduction histidine kinase